MQIPGWLGGQLLRARAAKALCAGILVTATAACGASEDEKSSVDDITGGASNGNGAGAGNGASGGDGSSAGAGSGGAQPGGNSSPDEDGGSSPMSGEADTFFRADSLKLLEPTLVLKPAFLPQQDITGTAQDAVNEGLVEDNEPDDGDGVADSGDGDGYVDLNAIIKFIGGVDPTEAGGFVTAGAGLCPYPYEASQACGPLALGPFQEPAEYTHGKDCKLNGASSTAPGSCFSSQQGAFTVNIQLIGAVPLQNTQVIGSWVDGAKGGISNGWIRGFLSEEVAMKTKLPQQLPIAALLLGIQPGTPLIDFLADADKSSSPAGWWFTLQYTAKPAVYDPKVGPDGQK